MPRYNHKHDNLLDYSEGILFPRSPDGTRSTTEAGKRIFAAAVRNVDPQAADAIRAEKSWHRRYPQHLVLQEELAILNSEAALQIARDGLREIHRSFEFSRNGQVMPLSEAMATITEPRLHTGTIRGRVEFHKPELEVPYRHEILSGDRLARQVAHWEAQGIIEPSHGEAIRRVMKNPDWLDLSDQQFILLGAGAEIGPLPFLARLRANIIAVDLPRPHTWARLIGTIRESAGKMRLPLHVAPGGSSTDEEIARQAGANLLTDTPELQSWLTEFDESMTIGAYAYLDGSDHVRVAVAMDALVEALTEKRKRISLAMLASATDAYVVPIEAAEAAHARYSTWSASRVWQLPLRVLTHDRLFAPNITKIVKVNNERRYGIFDGLVVRQGPNYALAKRMQKWRAIVTRDKGVMVSTNVAPPSSTSSVIKNRAFAAAYAGAHHYGTEIFQPETTNAVMGALLVHDLRHPESVANPSVSLNNPLELFLEGANHGGVWRTSMQIRSVLEIAALRGWRGRPRVEQ